MKGFMLIIAIVLMGRAACASPKHKDVWTQPQYMRIDTAANNAAYYVDTSRHDVSGYVDSSGNQHVRLWWAKVTRGEQTYYGTVILCEYVYTPGITYWRVISSQEYMGTAPYHSTNSRLEWDPVVPGTVGEDIAGLGLSMYREYNNSHYLKPSPEERWEYNLTDARDGHVYQTTVIGSQIWMAQNLNYAAVGSWCYDDDMNKCTEYGRLYDWKTAATVCPEGWHLPSSSEWADLLGTVSVGAVKKLKSQSWGGTDTYKFGMLPGGLRLYGKSYGADTIGTSFWSSSSDGTHDEAWCLSTDSTTHLAPAVKQFSFSVRCLKN